MYESGDSRVLRCISGVSSTPGKSTIIPGVTSTEVLDARGEGVRPRPEAEGFFANLVISGLVGWETWANMFLETCMDVTEGLGSGQGAKVETDSEAIRQRSPGPGREVSGR